jgi:hypothetical protein
MAKTYTSVSRDELQQAFGLAHRLGQSEDVPPELRRRFEEIARLIWKAHGEPGYMPAELPAGYPGGLPPLKLHRHAFALVWPRIGGEPMGVVGPLCECGRPAADCATADDPKAPHGDR